MNKYLVFNPYNYKDKEGKSSIYLYVFVSRKIRKYINTGIRVEEKFWNDDKKVIKDTHTDSINLNNKLSIMMHRIGDKEIKLLASGKQITIQDVQDIIANKPEKKKFLTFNEYYKKNLDSDHTLKSSTKADKNKTLTKLDIFNPELSYENIHPDTLTDFEKWLINYSPISESTVMKHQKNIKTYLTKYIKDGIRKGLFKPENDPYENGYKVKKIRGNREDLTQEEVKRIEDIPLEEGSKTDFYRDVFLFACYTGLRISDLENLNTRFIQTSEKEGISIMLHRMVKVDREVFLPLRFLFEGKPEQLLLKFISLEEINECISTRKHKKIFRGLERNRGNASLKTIAHLARINKSITWHVARHTFGTNLAALTGDQVLIMDLMGITKPETAMVYIHRSKERTTQKLMHVEWNKYDKLSNS